MSCLRWMMILSLVFLGSGCGDSDGDQPFIDGNEDPQHATCDTAGVLSCIGAHVCVQYYSDEAAEAVTQSCSDLNMGIRLGPCPQEYSLCCLTLEGMHDYPEGFCYNPTTDASYVIEEGECLSNYAAAVYCID